MMKESKLVVLGAGGVGKSSLILQYLQGTFSSSYRPTVEDCYRHTLQLPNGLYHALEILDTAGSHHFPAMRELSIRCGRAFVVVFSVDNEQSFHEAKTLCRLIHKIKDEDNVPVVVVGNKIDLSAERSVSWQSAFDFVTCKVSNGSYLETSAKYNLYINDVFNELLTLAFGVPKHEKRNRPCRLSLSISDMSFSSYRRKSSSPFSSSSSTTLSGSGRSCSEYSFQGAKGSGQSQDSISRSQESSPTRRKKKQQRATKGLAASFSQRRSLPLFSQPYRLCTFPPNSLLKNKQEKCVLF